MFLSPPGGRELTHFRMYVHAVCAVYYVASSLSVSTA